MFVIQLLCEGSEQDLIVLFSTWSVFLHTRKFLFLFLIRTSWSDIVRGYAVKSIAWSIDYDAGYESSVASKIVMFSLKARGTKSIGAVACVYRSVDDNGSGDYV